MNKLFSIYNGTNIISIHKDIFKCFNMIMKSSFMTTFPNALYNNWFA